MSDRPGNRQAAGMASSFSLAMGEQRPSISSSSSSQPPKKSYATSYTLTLEEEVAGYDAELERILGESLASTQRSVQRLDDSERIGAATAQELVSQHEKLAKVAVNLDDIHATTTSTQRNLNRIKSFFGGILKNKFTRRHPKQPKPEVELPAQIVGVPGPSAKLQALIETENVIDASIKRAGSPSLGAETRAALAGTRHEAVNRQIDENLDTMSSTLGRLRCLGEALNEEVDNQNVLLDSIQAKASRNDAIIRSQDAQMTRLLGGK